MGLTRSQQMARIRSTNTSPELRLASALRASGVRATPHHRAAGVRIDLALRRTRVAVFVDGCFFHGCPRHYVRPRSNVDFWAAKLRENVGRDCRQTLALEADGWIVVRAWEHEVFERLEAVVARVQAAARSGRTRFNGRRVVRVEPIDADDLTERRMIATLRNPDKVVDIREGRRVTAKWRRLTGAGGAARRRRRPSARGGRPLVRP